MPQGIIWVASRVQNPEVLSDEKFCDWYENTHIYEVTSLPGVPRAARYEAIQPQPDPKTWSAEAPWLTVYEMPDVEYRQTKEFKGLDGQSKPSDELLEGIFKQARYDTRFYEEVQVVEPKGAKEGPASLLISAAFSPATGTDDDFDAWYRKEHLQVLSEAPGYRRSRRYKLVSGTTLNKFDRTWPELPQYLALHEYDGGEFPWKELGASAQTDWAKKIMGTLEKEEVGWYRLKRVYAEDEKKTAVKA